ncbi:MAG: FAD-dependent oxidoreductase [Planctomycetota bacterium]
MANVVVVGGGPAGATAARALKHRGHEVVLIESRPQPEKPCGGGLTGPAWRCVAPYVEDIPRRIIRSAVVRDPSGRVSEFRLNSPLVIVSRRDLDARLCAAARAAGVRYSEDRVVALEPDGRRTLVRTVQAVHAADFVVGADGAKSLVRKTLQRSHACAMPTPITQFSISLTAYPRRTMPDRIDLKFFPDWNGYAWLFPRTDHVSAGICAAAHESPALLKARLCAYLDEVLGEPCEGVVGALIPSFDADTIAAFPVAGDGYALVGDAAGAVDPLTREGIRFAIRTGEMVGEVDAPLAPRAYRRAYQREIGSELRHAAQLVRRFFRTETLERFVGCMSRSRHAANVFSDLIAGTQRYRTLIPRCILLLPVIALDCWRHRRMVS